MEVEGGFLAVVLRFRLFFEVGGALDRSFGGGKIFFQKESGCDELSAIVVKSVMGDFGGKIF